MSAAPRFSSTAFPAIPRARHGSIGPLRTLVALALVALAAAGIARGQDSELARQRQAARATFLAQQDALAQECQTLIASGATPAQMQTWQQQNGSRIAAQQRRAQTLSLLSSWDLLPLPNPAGVPGGASSMLAAFTQLSAALQFASVQLHNQWAQTLPIDATADEIVERQAQEAAIFQQWQAAELASLAQQAEALAAESAGQSSPPPPPLRIPADATPQLSAYLVACESLMRADLAMRSQYADADPAARQAAFQRWQQQNAARISQLQQLAQALSPNP